MDSSSDGSSVENRLLPDGISNVNTGGRTRLDISRKKKPVASRSAKLIATVSNSGEEESIDAAPTRTKLSISRRLKPKASRQAITTSRSGASELGGLSRGEEEAVKPSRQGRTRTFGVGIARNKIGAMAPKKEEPPKVFHLLSSKVTNPGGVTINPGNNTTIITGDVPQLYSRGIDLVKEYPEITIANGQDTTLLDQVSPILSKKKIEPIKTVTVVEQSAAVPTDGAKKTRRTRTFGVGIERKKFSTNTSAPKQQADRVFYLSSAPRSPVEIAPSVANATIASGSDTTTLGGPVPTLDSRVIAVDKTLQPKEIENGSDTTQTTLAPQLDKRSIATNNIIGATMIANGSDTTALGSPSALDVRVIAPNKTLQLSKVNSGLNSTSLPLPPQLTKREILPNKTIINPVIATGNNTTTLGGPVPTLDSRTIPTNKTIQELDIVPGSDSTAVNPAPVLAQKEIAKDKTVTTTTSANSTSLSTSSYLSTSSLESTLNDIGVDDSLNEDISIISNESLPLKRTSSILSVQNIVKVAAEHYVKNVGSYAIDSIDAITGIIANRLDGLFKPSAISVAADDNPNILERGVWLKIFGSKTIQDGHSQSNARFENKQQGFVLGADIDFKGEVTCGIAFSMNDSNTDFFSHINNYQESKLYYGILYGEFSMWDNFAINAQLKYGHSFIKHSILTKLPIRGKTRGSILGASLEGIYKFVSNRTQITPLVRVSYTSYEIYDFTEKNKQGNIQVQIPNKKASMISTFESLSFLSATFHLKLFKLNQSFILV